MTALHHIAMHCRDIKKQEAFYKKHFGFKRARTFNAGTPDEFVMLRLGACCLELFQADRLAARATKRQSLVGFTHLAFEIDNLEAAIKRLHKDGIATDDMIDCSKLVPGLRICFFNDPDGNRVELMNGWRDETK